MRQLLTIAIIPIVIAMSATAVEKIQTCQKRALSTQTVENRIVDVPVK
jgi:hypothetical protein